MEGIREQGGRLSEILVHDPGPFFETEGQMVNMMAYAWLDWIGAVTDWQDATRRPSLSKKPWGFDEEMERQRQHALQMQPGRSRQGRVRTS